MPLDKALSILDASQPIKKNKHVRDIKKKILMLTKYFKRCNPLLNQKLKNIRDI